MRLYKENWFTCEWTLIHNSMKNSDRPIRRSHNSMCTHKVRGRAKVCHQAKGSNCNNNQMKVNSFRILVSIFVTSCCIAIICLYIYRPVHSLVGYLMWLVLHECNLFICCNVEWDFQCFASEIESQNRDPKMKIKALKSTFLFIDNLLKLLVYASHSHGLDGGCSPVIQTLDIRFLQFHLYTLITGSNWTFYSTGSGVFIIQIVIGDKYV